MEKKHNYSVVILSAGLSERMGQPKMFLKWNHLTFIENIVKGYEKFGCKEIIVVLNEKDYTPFKWLKMDCDVLKIIKNNHVDWGRFYSLKLGLSALSSANHCFINNIDSPFVDQKVLSEMSSLINNHNYVVPVWNNIKGHPVLIGRKIIEIILDENDFKLNIKEYLKKFNCTLCSVDNEKILININTIEDYNSAIEKFQMHD